VPAEPDEVAWVCANCGQGLLLDEEAGLKAITVHSAAHPGGEATRRPYWVALGRVRFTRRESYGRDAAPNERWGRPVQFVLPAFAATVEQAVGAGVTLLERPPELVEGEAQLLRGAAVLPDEIEPLARFVVLSIEAARDDKLEAIEFIIDLGPPELWLLPS
jgi:hypothetical protein